MLKVYPAILHEEGGYWIEFPDLEGCQTYGETLEETMELAQEALGLYLVSLIENKQEIPAPSNIADLTADEGQLTYISTDIDKYRRDTRANAVHPCLAGKGSGNEKHQPVQSTAGCIERTVESGVKISWLMACLKYEVGNGLLYLGRYKRGQQNIPRY